MTKTEWRVEPAGIPSHRYFILVRRRTDGGELEIMLDEHGDPHEFPSAAAAQATAVIDAAAAAAKGPDLESK
jgi:hypothetical protein